MSFAQSAVAYDPSPRRDQATAQHPSREGIGAVRRRTNPSAGLRPSEVPLRPSDRGLIAADGATGAGRLDSPERRFDLARPGLEALFGRDFSGVRIHTGSRAAASARVLHARAYTVGSDIVFAEGEFQPWTHAGQRLMAHELAHVVQQSRGDEAPARSHELEADAASDAVSRGQRVAIRTGSRVGIARQAGDGGRERLVDPSAEPENWGLRVTRYHDINARVEKVLSAPGPMVAEGRADFNKDPRIAKASLYQSNFRDDQERLSYAVGVFRQFLGAGGGPVSPGDLRDALRAYETQVERGRSDIIIHAVPTKDETRRLLSLREARDYRFFQAEVLRIQREQASRVLATTGVYSGAATVDAYQQFIGAPFEAAVSKTVEQAPFAVSVLLDFTPVIGQLKAVVEAILGRDLITGAELATWQRGLNLLLALLPEAKGIFRAGRSGLTALARLVAESSLPAEEAYRTAKVASTLSADEVKAAQAFVDGVPANAAQARRVARALEEISGEATSTSTASAARVADATATHAAQATGAATGELVGNTAEVVELSREVHTLTVRRAGGKLRIWLCSNDCGELIMKAQAALERLPANHKARGALARFIQGAERTLAPIRDLADAEVAMKELRAGLENIERRYPGAFDPNVPTPAAVSPTSAPASAQAFSDRVLVGALDEQGRATYVTGELRPSDLHTGTKTGDVYPPGLGRGELDPLGARRGHLLANLFGGRGTEAGNLVWLHEFVNNSAYKTEFENLVADALRRGDTVHVDIHPHFRGSGAAPYEVEVWAATDKGAVVVPHRRIATPGLSDVFVPSR